MSNFHEIALQSVLFKGRHDWYYCYLKAEKIAHVLHVLAKGGGEHIREIAGICSEIPKSIAYAAAGEYTQEMLLADIFASISEIRLGATEDAVDKETAKILIEEYELLVRRLVATTHPSPFISRNDFEVPLLPQKPISTKDVFLGSPESAAGERIKDNKGHDFLKDTKKDIPGGDNKDRPHKILDIVRKNNGVSIKDISALVRDCSEKTIQRELVSLIEQGLIRKVGERRWSLYFGTEKEGQQRM